MINSKFIIGVDPGKEPAVCSMHNLGKFEIKKFKKAKGEFNFFDFSEYFVGMLNDFSADGSDKYEVVIYIEDVHSVHNSSAKANFQFGRSVGIIRGVIEYLVSNADYNCSIEMVQPKVWQKEIWEKEDKPLVKSKGHTKITSYEASKRILGSNWEIDTFLPTKRSSVASHDMIDAFLIAYYGCLNVNK